MYSLCVLFWNEIVQMVFLVSFGQYKTSKEGSTMGITVSNAATLAHCHALTQACGYTEGREDPSTSHYLFGFSVTPHQSVITGRFDKCAHSARCFSSWECKAPPLLQCPSFAVNNSWRHQKPWESLWVGFTNMFAASLNCNAATNRNYNYFFEIMMICKCFS